PDLRGTLTDARDYCRHGDYVAECALPFALLTPKIEPVRGNDIASEAIHVRSGHSCSVHSCSVSSCGGVMPGPSRMRAGPLDSWVFRQAVGAFTTGVTVVTRCDESGERYGLTATSFPWVSLDPPLVLFCVDNSAPSLQGFIKSQHFAINVLAA